MVRLWDALADLQKDYGQMFYSIFVCAHYQLSLGRGLSGLGTRLLRCHLHHTLCPPSHSATAFYCLTHRRFCSVATHKNRVSSKSVFDLQFHS